MTEETQTVETAKTLDPVLLARMTGELGDQETVGKFGVELAAVYTEFLPDVFHSETGFDIEVTYGGISTGVKEDLIAGLGETVALCDASLRGWCPDFTLACGNTFVMTLVEALLGAEPKTIAPPQSRSLSKIELDLADMVFSRISSVLRSAVAAAGTHEAVLNKPYNAATRPKPAEGYQDPAAAIVTMNVKLGQTESQIHVVLPQRTLLKTKIISPKSASGGRVKKEWSDQIKEQVQRSQVAVEARIKLQSLTLGTLSRLQVGDVIPFMDIHDVRVDVNANGKELYFGEFGRSGSKYTVRVADTYTTETDLLTHLMG
jgi:flagellar motor switch protein FliM